MAPKTRNVSRKRKERSPIVEFPPEDVEELIDLSVSKIVETADEGESSKHNEVAAASTAIEVYRPPGALQTLDDFRGVVTLEELSLLERDEVYPYLDLSHLEQDKGFVNISSALFSRGTRPGIDVYPVDLSDSGLKRFVDFPAMGPCSRVVPGSVIEKHFLDQLGCDCLKNSWEKVKVWFDYTGSTKRNEGWNIDELMYFAKSGRDPALDKKYKLVMRQALKTIGRTSHIYCSTTVAFLAIAHVDPELENMRPDWHAWCANEIRFRLRHSKTDKHSKAKFREVWHAVVELVTRDFLAKQAVRLQQQSSVLQLEYSSDAKNAFAETKVVWDAERGELVAERERLRTELEEAQSREECSASIPLAWVKEFYLVRELDLKALHERLLCSMDMRSLSPSQFGDSDDLHIVGIPTMRLQKKKYLDSLHQELSDKTCAFIRSIKQGSRLKLYPPPHRVTGTQFQKWSQMEIRVKMIEWTHLWDYPSNKCWIFSAKCTPCETTCHNRALVTVAIDVPRGDNALQMLCKINMALCIRLRPWDGIFLELFAHALLVTPWALDILNTLVEKQLVTVWRTGHIPLQVLQPKTPTRLALVMMP
ncbi:hypothetical protein R1sor_020174 [Riccia sorocarpa]|uniref:Uncharacterized protein n=1 Tax=Riccia sorocarpa TaxID=122646 RepID=A0ABD3IES2_9MARC